jgi:hypothetical protein
MIDRIAAMRGPASWLPKWTGHNGSPNVKTGGATSLFPISLPVGAGTDNCGDQPMKFQTAIAIFAALVVDSTYFASN